MMEPRLTLLGEPDKRSAKVIDLTDMTFGRLTVVGRAPRPAYYARKGAWWLCRCECGKEVAVDGQNLRSKNTRSCGCLLSEMGRAKMDHARQYRWKHKEAIS